MLLPVLVLLLLLLNKTNDFFLGIMLCLVCENIVDCGGDGVEGDDEHEDEVENDNASAQNFSYLLPKLLLVAPRSRSMASVERE